MIKQSDFLPEEKARYPLLLIKETDENTANILNCIQDGTELPICLERFGEILQIKVMDVELPVINFMINNCTLALVISADEARDFNDITTFMNLYSNFKKAGVTQ